MTWTINVYDNDYNSLVTRELFEGTEEEAEEYCKENTWTGHTYVVEK